MATSRPLTAAEERALVRYSRRLPPRDAALIAAQLGLGFRISETLSLTVGQVLRDGAIRPVVAIPPRKLKGRRGRTRAIAVGPELNRALTRYLSSRARREHLVPSAPLFLSVRRDARGNPKAIFRTVAERIIKRALVHVCGDPHGLSTHSTRKTWAMRLYQTSGHDLLIVRDGLGHSSVAITENYLPVRAGAVNEMVRRSDRSRHSSETKESTVLPKRPRVRAAEARPEPFLPGFESFAA